MHGAHGRGLRPEVRGRLGGLLGSGERGGGGCAGDLQRAVCGGVQGHHGDHGPLRAAGVSWKRGRTFCAVVYEEVLRASTLECPAVIRQEGLPEHTAACASDVGAADRPGDDPRHAVPRGSLANVGVLGVRVAGDGRPDAVVRGCCPQCGPRRARQAQGGARREEHGRRARSGAGGLDAQRVREAPQASRCRRAEGRARRARGSR